MTALQLYKFWHRPGVDFRIPDNGITEDCEIIIWISFDRLEEFTDMLGDAPFDERAMPVLLKENCISFDIMPLLSDFDFELEEIKEIFK